MPNGCCRSHDIENNEYLAKFQNTMNIPAETISKLQILDILHYELHGNIAKTPGFGPRSYPHRYRPNDDDKKMDYDEPKQVSSSTNLLKPVPIWQNNEDEFDVPVDLEPAKPNPLTKLRSYDNHMENCDKYVMKMASISLSRGYSVWDTSDDDEKADTIFK